jgi:hypothetical protein
LNCGGRVVLTRPFIFRARRALKPGGNMKIINSLLLLLFLVSGVTAAEKRFSVPVGDSPQKGPKDAAVTIIEFIDFQ